MNPTLSKVRPGLEFVFAGADGEIARLSSFRRNFAPALFTRTRLPGLAGMQIVAVVFAGS